MINFPTGSFLYVKLLQILFVGKVRKTRTTAGYNLLLNIYKKSIIWSVQRVLNRLKWYFLHVGKENRPNVRPVGRKGDDVIEVANEIMN